MRWAGYEVRVLRSEGGGSFEENPPTLLDHVEREARWCLGNLQYVRLLGLPGIAPTSRFQLVAAVMMFMTAPALTLSLLLLPLATIQVGASFPGVSRARSTSLGLRLDGPETRGLHRDPGVGIGQRAGYGGRARFAVGAVVGACLLVPALSRAVRWLTLAMFRALTGRRSAWNPQERDGSRIPLARRGVVSGMLRYRLVPALATLWFSPAAFLWGPPLLAGLLLCVPFAVATSLRRSATRWAGGPVRDTRRIVVRLGNDLVQ